MSFQSLPAELIVEIFVRLGTSDESALALVRCGWTCRYLRAATTQSRIWHSIYNTRYTIADPLEEAKRLIATGGDYAKRYSLRRRLDQEALRILEDIVHHRANRLRLAERVAYDMGLDVHDLLLKESRTWPHECTGDLPSEHGSSHDINAAWLSVSYWAKELLGVLARLEAVRGWKKVLLRPQSASYAEGLTCFSGFRGVRPSKILSDLNKLGMSCEHYLMNNSCALDTTNPDCKALEISRQICAWMRLQGFDRVSDEDYHQLDNHFLDAVLTTNKETLPLSLVVVFVVLARHVGLDASPVAFPHHVHAVVPDISSPDGYLHLDIFNAGDRLVLPLAELEAKLDGMGVPAEERQLFLQPATVRAVCLRAAGNIQQSCRQGHMNFLSSRGVHLDYLRDCAYAVMTAMLILNHLHPILGGQALLEMVKLCRNRHSLDWCILQRDVKPLFLVQALSPARNATGTAMEFEEQLTAMLLEEERTSLSIKHSVDSNVPAEDSGPIIKYHVGTIVRHTLSDQIGVITNWKVTCETASELTSRFTLGPDTSPSERGCPQPFYMIYDIDGTMRYVAEEDLDVTALPEDIWGTIRDLVRKASDLGRYFDRAEVGNGVGRLIMGSDLLTQHPRDAVLCARALGLECGGPGRIPTTSL